MSILWNRLFSNFEGGDFFAIDIFFAMQIIIFDKNQQRPSQSH